MSVAIVTGSCGLVGSETSLYFADRGMYVVGIDNDLRSHFFGRSASTEWMRKHLESEIPGYSHYSIDIRDEDAIQAIFRRYASDISLVVHTAAQPSHDWAASDPKMDLTVNLNGTSNVLEATRKHAPDAVFIFTSTNKVYGDLPNHLPLVEQETRYEVSAGHPFAANGIDESMSIDQSLHSLFGASKAAADVLVQEYGRYFGMKTGCFRGGCLTGPNHSGAQLHGFLAYLMKCVITGEEYTIFGYKGKQVRDNIHSADLVRAFDEFVHAPRPGAVYNMGGGRFSNCSMIEAIRACEEIAGRPLTWKYVDQNRIGDHIWYISDLSRFKADYPAWQQQYDIRATLQQMYENQMVRYATATRMSA